MISTIKEMKARRDLFLLIKKIEDRQLTDLDSIKKELIKLHDLLIGEGD